MSIAWGDPSNFIDFWETVMDGETKLDYDYKCQEIYTLVEDAEFEDIEE